MDLAKIIRELRIQKEKIVKAIALLEDQHSPVLVSADELPESQRSAAAVRPKKGGTRRGRKSMSAEGRAEVSKRMRKYWANRGKAGPNLGGRT